MCNSYRKSDIVSIVDRSHLYYNTHMSKKSTNLKLIRDQLVYFLTGNVMENTGTVVMKYDIKKGET